MIGVVVVVAVVAVVTSVLAAPDYCQLPSCPGGIHTCCKFSNPAEKCTKDAGPLTDEERKLILDTHNELRQTLAAGKLDGFSGATDMETMQWDQELETIAQTWADQCDYKHDECRNTERWPVGQNIAVTGNSDGYKEEILKKVMMWWDEYKEYPYKDGTFKFSMGTGHFTQMAWAKTNKIGCGRSSYSQSSFVNEYLVCDYGPTGNFVGQKIYTAGSRVLLSSSLLTALCSFITLTFSMQESLIKPLV